MRDESERQCPEQGCQIKDTHYHLLEEKTPFTCDGCGQMLIVDVGYIWGKSGILQRCVWNQGGEYLTYSVEFLECCPGYEMTEERQHG